MNPDVENFNFWFGPEASGTVTKFFITGAPAGRMPRLYPSGCGCLFFLIPFAFLLAYHTVKNALWVVSLLVIWTCQVAVIPGWIFTSWLKRHERKRKAIYESHFREYATLKATRTNPDHFRKR